MSAPYVYVYVPYPRRLYFGGVVLPNDPHATNSVVVEDEAGEAAARAQGYRKPHEKESAANGGSGESTHVLSAADASPFSQDQGAVAGASADPSDVDALRAQAAALGLKVHHKAGAEKLRAAIAGAGK